MALGNMRANGIHTLAAWCGGRGCNHQAVIDVSRYSDDVPVTSFGRRMVCTVCGAIGADARPNWNERYSAGRRLRGCNAADLHCILLEFAALLSILAVASVARW
jgi:hypothetical protein